MADEHIHARLHLTVLDSAAAIQEWGEPPAPKSFLEPDPPGILHGIDTESVTVRSAVIDGRMVEVETARISGGLGFDHEPAIRAVWRVASGHWVLAQGFAAEPATLDTLFAMLRTMRMAGLR